MNAWTLKMSRRRRAVEGRGVGVGGGMCTSRGIEVSPVGWRVTKVDEERVGQALYLMKNRYRKPFGGRWGMGGW